jgi:hypothetical protein
VEISILKNLVKMWLVVTLLIAAYLPCGTPKWLESSYYNVLKHLKRDLAMVLTTSIVGFGGATIAQGDDIIGAINTNNLPSDEYMVRISEKSKLGIGLLEVNYQKYLRVVVNSVKDDAVAAIKQNVLKDDIIVKINDQNTEGISKDEVYKILKETDAPYSLFFRRPNKFYSLLDSSVNGNLMSHITTVVAPATTNSKKQMLDIKRILTGDSCSSGAKRGDIIEVVVTKDSEVSNDDVKGEFYILGDQESDLPPGLQLGLYGMCPREIRSVQVPPSLLGTEDVSNQVYTVKLISLSEVQ